MSYSSDSSSHERVVVFDTTLRDGEQAAGVGFSVQDKLDIAEQLEALGVDVIEAGFAAASEIESAAIRAIADRARSSRIVSSAGQ